MKAVRPSEKVCLLLDETFMPFRVITARSAFYHLFKRHGNGITVEKQFFTWDDILNKTVLISDAQPVMRSASDVWVIPTVFKLNNHFFTKLRKLKAKKKISLRDLYDHYHGICQYCGNKKRYGQFSRDHVYPKSKGGSDEGFNLILSCIRCNGEKGDQFPYRNHKGEIVKPKGFYNVGTQESFFLTREPREEWKTFLFLDDFTDEEKENLEMDFDNGSQ